MATRTARTSWHGSLESGAGRTELVSSGVGTFDVSFPKRTADDAGATTSPEELLGAALSSCFAMQLSAFVGDEGGEVDRLDVEAIVSLGPDPTGGLRLRDIALTIDADLRRIDAIAFGNAVEQAATMCPVSKALAGVPIAVTLGDANVTG